MKSLDRCRVLRDSGQLLLECMAAELSDTRPPSDLSTCHRAIGSRPLHALKDSTVSVFKASAILPSLFSASLLAFAGCGGDAPVGGPEGLIPVTGMITLDGAPVPNANITFTPKREGGTSTGYTDEQGQYELYFGPSAKGAVEGEHVVTIDVGEGAEPQIPDDVDTAGMSEREVSALMDKYMAKPLPEKYTSGQVELTASVIADGGPYDFDLKSD